MENFIQQQLYIDDSNNMIYKEPELPYVIYHDGVLVFRDTIQKDLIPEIGEKIGLPFKFVRLSGSCGRRQALKGAEEFKRECILEQKCLVILTNLTDFINSGIFNTWNEKTQRFQVLFLTKDYELLWADECTDRELHAGHNLEAIYRNGGFDLDEGD